MPGVFVNLVNFILRGPKLWFKQRLKLPLIRFIDSILDIFKTRARSGLYTTKDVLLKGTVVAFITTLLVWLSVFMYLAFYFTYVPQVAHERPVHLTFRTSHDKPHSYLEAHVQLTNRQQLLMMGQPYRVQLDLEMPESPANKELGMFMVCANFHTKAGKLIAKSCRSSMLHYRSPLLDFIYTLFYSPLYILGSAEEKQILHIEMFAKYEEVEGPAVTDVYVEIQSNQIQLYSAKFLINAEFTGLRYFMFSWPLLSAALGITSNLFFIAIIGIISWYQLIHSDEYKQFIYDKEHKSQDIPGEDTCSSSSIEDISTLERFREETNDSDVIEDIQQVVEEDLRL